MVTTQIKKQIVDFFHTYNISKQFKILIEILKEYLM